MPVVLLSVLLVLSATALPGSAASGEDWTVYDTAPMKRIVYAYAELPDGRIFIAAGANVSSFSLSNESWIYDPYEKAWDQVADCPVSVESSTAVAMPDGKVYVFGGMSGTMADHVLIYDVEADEWSYGSFLAESVIIAEAVAIDDTHILLAGGLTSMWLTDTTTHCWIYDTESSLFTAAGDLPEERCCGSMVVYGDRAFYLGGLDSSSVGHDEIYAYSIASDYWYTTGYLPVPLLNAAAVAGSDGNIYIIGGENAFGWYSPGSENAYAYNVFIGTSRLLPELPAPVLNSAAFELSDGRIMYLMGNDGSEGNTDVVTLQAWEGSASLSSNTVGQGGSVRLNLNVETNFIEKYGMSGEVHLVMDNVTYASYYIDSVGENSVSLELAVPEELPAGDYQVTLSYVNVGWGYDQAFPFETLELTVTEAPSTADRLDALQDQNDALQDRLDDLEQQNQDLGDQLEDARQELKDATDAKLDAMIGYVILIVALGALIVGVIVLVRKK